MLADVQQVLTESAQGLFLFPHQIRECLRDASEELWIVRHSRVSNQQWICSVGATLEQLKLDEHADENQLHDSMHGRMSPTNLAKLARINKTLHGRQENIA